MSSLSNKKSFCLSLRMFVMSYDDKNTVNSNVKVSSTFLFFFFSGWQKITMKISFLRKRLTQALDKNLVVMMLHFRIAFQIKTRNYLAAFDTRE